MPSVSAIVPTRDRPELATEALESIINQSRPPDEIIIADDGDGAAGATLAKRFGARVVHTGGQGSATARNRAIELARSDWLAFCDDDDTWHPDRLARQLKLAHGETVLVFADALRSDGTREWSGRHPVAGRAFDALVLDNWIPTSTVLLRRDAWERAGGFEKQFEPAEDYRLWLRVARIGDFELVNEPLATYRLHPGQLQKNRGRMFGATAAAVEESLREDGRPANHFPGLSARLRALRFVQGRELMRLGDGAAARACFRAAWQHDPTYLQAYLFFAASGLLTK